MSLADVLGSVFGGGITGLVGAVAQRVYEYKSKQLDVQMAREKFANDVAMKQADAAIMAQEWAARTKVAQTEEQGKEAVADAQAFSSALTSEPQRFSDSSKLSPGQEWLMVFLDLVRALVRPVLTLYLCVLTTLIYREAKALLGGQTLTPEQALLLTNKVVETILYLTTTCVMFYFGSRNKERTPKL